MSEKVTVEIPKADEKSVASIPSGEFGDIKQGVDRLNQIIYGVIAAVIISMVAVVVSVIGIFLDQMHFNNAAYREYLNTNRSIEAKNNATQQSLDQNKQNQELILKQQDQIIKLLGK